VLAGAPVSGWTRRAFVFGSILSRVALREGPSYFGLRLYALGDDSVATEKA
jgi:hypothetical protein